KEAVKEKKKGRAKGEIITGVRRDIEEFDDIGKGKGVNAVKRTVAIIGEKWQIFTVYSKQMNKTREETETMMEENRAGNLLIRGYFNAQIRIRGSRTTELEGGEI